MYIISITESFDAAHFLSGYDGKCSNIHGHQWNVEINIQAMKLHMNGSNKGMVEDFTDIKEDIRELMKVYDHALIIEKGSLKKETTDCLIKEGFKIIFLDFRTTAENLAYYFYLLVEEKGYNVKSVTVYETPNNAATYEK